MHKRIIIHLLFVFCILKKTINQTKVQACCPPKYFKDGGTACLFCIIVSLFGAISSSVELAKL